MPPQLSCENEVSDRKARVAMRAGCILALEPIGNAQDQFQQWGRDYPASSHLTRERGSQAASVVFVFQQNTKGCVSILKEQRPWEVGMAISPQLLFSQQCAISTALSYNTFCNHYFSHRIWTFFSSSSYLLHLESFLMRSPLFSVQCHKHFCISSGKTLSKNIWLCQDSARLMTHRHFTSH